MCVQSFFDKKVSQGLLLLGFLAFLYVVCVLLFFLFVFGSFVSVPLVCMNGQIVKKMWWKKLWVFFDPLAYLFAMQKEKKLEERGTHTHSLVGFRTG
jgi:energy-coupling factor transporter transmembrane protein EcfT